MQPSDWPAVRAIYEQGIATRRACYAGVVEESVYVAEGARGTGVGTALLRELAQADDVGVWTIQTSIFPENVASGALHRCCGFRVVGTRERISRLGGTWRDTVLLERRADAGEPMVLPRAPSALADAEGRME